MYKEMIISIIIIIAILVGDMVSQNYTKQSIKVIEESLEEIRQELEKGDENQTIIEEKIANIKQEWKYKNEKLAYYIEHDELEKVEVELYALNANIDTKEYEQGIEKVEKCKFILKHIENKEAFNLKNIF